jgi:hypothetical protein
MVDPLVFSVGNLFGLDEAYEPKQATTSRTTIVARCLRADNVAVLPISEERGGGDGACGMRLMPSAYIPRGSKMTVPPAVDEPGALDAAGDPNSPWRRFMQREVLDPLQTEIIEPGTRPDPKLTNAVTNITRRLTMTGPEAKQAERQDRREARHPSVSLFEPPITGSVSGSPAANQSSTTMGWNPGMPTGDGIMEGLNWFDRILKDHGIGTTGPATSGGSATAPPRMLPDRATHALTPDGQVIPTDRTSDAWGGGTGPSAVGFAADGVTPITVSPSKVIRIDPATGIPGTSPTAYIDQTAYNAARSAVMSRGNSPSPRSMY